MGAPARLVDAPLRPVLFYMENIPAGARLPAEPSSSRPSTASDALAASAVTRLGSALYPSAKVRVSAVSLSCQE